MLDFLYYAVSWVLLRWHSLMNVIGLDPAGGANWALSIVLLVVTARLLLFRLFIKQVHYQRRMQELQPKLSAIKEKYKNDKAAQQREMMALQQQEGFNPLSGCLPLVAQLPVFIGLLHVLRHLAATSNQGYPDSQLTLYGFTADQSKAAGAAKFFGAPLSAQFQNTSGIIERLGGDVSTTRIVIVVLLIVSAVATFITQLQAMSRQTTVAEGTAALVQKGMKYLIPLGVLASGLIFNFPLGVLLYWFTSNLWTMAQQFYINKFHPVTPGTGGGGGSGSSGGPNGPNGSGGGGGRALAPKPGQKPVRPGTTRPASGPNLSKTPAGRSGGANSSNNETVNATSGGGSNANGVRTNGSGANGSGGKRASGRGSSGSTPAPTTTKEAAPTGRNSAGTNGAAATGGSAGDAMASRRPQPGRKPGQAKKRR